MSSALEVVRQYLAVEFPGSVIESAENGQTHRRNTVLFRVVLDGNDFELEVDKNLLDGNRVPRLSATLQERHAAAMMRANPYGPVTLGLDGWRVV